MLYSVKAYLKFLWHSKNEHAVHSPFVFSLITKCFYDTKNYTEYSLLNQNRKSLFNNKNHIVVNDFGAGSRVFKSNKRQIAKIAKIAGISSKKAKLLYRISQYFEPNLILELGTSLGLATTALAYGNQKGKVTTLEGCSETAAIAKKQWDNLGLKNINIEVTEFKNYLTESECQNTKYNLIYFDGNHSKKATLDYFEILLPTLTNDTVWIFDDIHWNKEMEDAWDCIKKHPKVTVTIDTFQWGLVFFRREQEKEHFVIRV